ncbi:MAG: 16S rRNA (uracil(1498)-N(3))-methyltransferase [Pyrinomonadaceae bacterium]
MRRFFAPPQNFNTGVATLDADETRHLRDVLRLKIGDEVSVFDGLGAEFRCEIRTIGKRSSDLTIIESTPVASPESDLDLTLAAAMVSGEKFDLVIQKSVELGVTRFVPLNTVRCDVKLKDAAKRLDRWRRIAMEATKQCGRAVLMEIADPVDLPNLIADTDPPTMLLFSERDGATFSPKPVVKKLTAVIGPKGGWDDGELELAAGNNVTVVTLGGRILRAETAAIAITAVLQHRFGDLT